MEPHRERYTNKLPRAQALQIAKSTQSARWPCPVALRSWYRQHLGIDVQEWGGAAFTWTDAAGNPSKGTTVWCIGAADGEQFAPSQSTFMVNYRVEDLAAVIRLLREEGCNVLEKSDDSEYGKFGWVIDPEGNKVELWQPPPGQ